nr:auxin-responsive protein SAUR21-like [Ipomoea trifida]
MGHILRAKQGLRRSSSRNNRESEVPKGYFAVYVGESEKKRFVIPVSYLKDPSFQDLLCQAEEEFGFDHPTGDLLQLLASLLCLAKEILFLWVAPNFCHFFAILISFLELIIVEADEHRYEVTEISNAFSSSLDKPRLRSEMIIFDLCFKKNHSRMAISMTRILRAKQGLRRSSSRTNRESEVPKGHFAVYVGESEKKRFVIPVSYLKDPSFQDLLCQAEDEFGFDHPMGGLTIPCLEDTFLDIISNLRS